MSKVFDIRAEMPNVEDMRNRAGLSPGGRVQAAIDQAVLRFSEKYIPFKTGTLVEGGWIMTRFGEGEVIYPGPYARYMYYGLVMGPNFPIYDDDSGVPTAWRSPKGQPKYLTGDKIQYDTSMNPLAGPRWFERMKADHLQDIIQEAQNVADGKQ